MSKIRIKIGEVELEYEGSDDFLREELPILLDKLYALAPTVTRSQATKDRNDKDQLSGSRTGDAAIGTTSSIAADLQVKTGPDLALAAAVRLTLGLGRESFSRKDLLSEMQGATAYYGKNMSSNLTSMLNAMIKTKVFRETAKDTYALSAETKRDMESRFGS